MAIEIPSVVKSLKLATLTVFLGFGLGACASDQEELEEPIQEESTEQLEADASEQDMYGEEGEVVMTDDEAPLEGDDVMTEDGTEDTGFLVEEDAVEAEEIPEQTQEEELMAGEDASTGTVDATLDDTDSGSEMMAMEDGSSELEIEQDTTYSDIPTDTTTASTYEDDSAPATTQSYESTPSQGSSNQNYVVEAGDTLARISKKIYGTVDRWQELANNNNISDPTKIFPGDELSFELVGNQAVNFASVLGKLQTKTVIVKKGDTMQSLAQQVFGPKASWRQLYAYNKSTVSNPNKIHVGQSLSYVPADQRKKLASVNGSPMASDDENEIAENLGE
jgi:nucleoid-associated protein YgaU